MSKGHYSFEVQCSLSGQTTAASAHQAEESCALYIFFPWRKNYREHSNIKSARVSALKGSVLRKMAEALQRISALIRSRTHVARHSATSLNLAIGLYQLLGKNSTRLVVFRHLQLIFLHTELSYSDFSTNRSRPDTKYENSWTQTFDRDILSHTAKIGVEIFSPRTILVQCSSDLIEQLIDLEKVRTANLKFRTDLRDRDIDGRSVTQ